MQQSIRREARFWWHSFWPPCKWALFVCVVGFTLLTVVDASRAPDPHWATVPVVALVGGLYTGFFVAPAVGLAALLWRLVGGWIIVPILLLPAGIVLAFWGMSGVLEARADALWQALRIAASEHQWAVLSAGPAARAGPVVLVIALPLLVLDLGVLVLSPTVLAPLFGLVVTVALVAAAGAIPPALVSSVVLSVSFVRRFKRRHAAAQSHPSETDQ